MHIFFTERGDPVLFVFLGISSRHKFYTMCVPALHSLVPSETLKATAWMDARAAASPMFAALAELRVACRMPHTSTSFVLTIEYRVIDKTLPG